MQLPSWVVNILAGKYTPLVTGTLSTIAGLAFLVPILQPGHPLAAQDIAGLVGFATIVLHALSGSTSQTVTIAKAANVPNAVEKVEAAVDAKVVVK